MTAFEIILLAIGVILMVGSFFMAEKLSASEVSRIAELSNDEIKRILDKHIEGSKSRVEEMVDDTIDNSMEIVEAALDKETNSKMLALGEYSDTVMESANKTHNEIMFLYSMLNDKHAELTDFASELQNMMTQMQKMELGRKNAIVRPAEIVREEPATVTEKDYQREEKQEIPEEIDEGDEQKNLNASILALHNKGIPNVMIAKELNIGLGEVQLVIGLYRGEGKA